MVDSNNVEIRDAPIIGIDR